MSRAQITLRHFLHLTNWSFLFAETFHLRKIDFKTHTHTVQNECDVKASIVENAQKIRLGFVWGSKGFLTLALRVKFPWFQGWGCRGLRSKFVINKPLSITEPPTAVRIWMKVHFDFTAETYCPTCSLMDPFSLSWMFPWRSFGPFERKRLDTSLLSFGARLLVSKARGI